MNIVYVYADSLEEWNSSEWRCAVPARAINRTRLHHADLLSIEEFAHQTSGAIAVCDIADVIVVQRNLFGPVLSAMQYWKARDKTVVADFDDAFDLMHPTNLNYSFWNAGISRQAGAPKMAPPPLLQFKWGLRLAHAATVPSKRLADDWHPYTDMFYLPNYIDLMLYENCVAEPHDGVIIGWGGSISHLQSFTDSNVIPAIKKVCRARPRVKLMICGNDPRILDSFPIPLRQKIFMPWVRYQDWPQVLAKFDIGIAPLHGLYDERRSWIKVLEYLVMKIPWVATDSTPYLALRNCGWLTANDSGAWERVLIDMVDHLDDYKAKASGDPYLAGISQNIDENIHHIIGIYNSIHEQAFGDTKI
jgi:glycosyltransferase involved in cell wall biosynthesis